MPPENKEKIDGEIIAYLQNNPLTSIHKIWKGLTEGDYSKRAVQYSIDRLISKNQIELITESRHSRVWDLYRVKSCNN